MDKKKISKVLKQLLKSIDNAGLSRDEAVLLYGNLGYSIGAAIADLTQNPPTLQELEISYLTNPSIGNFLMLTGLNVSMRVCSEKVNPQIEDNK